MSKTDLITMVEWLYGFRLQNAEFLFSGWGGECFAGYTNHDITHFIKLSDLERPTALAPSSPEFYLPLMDELKKKKVLPNIPRIVRTAAHEFSASAGAKRIIITRYIKGRSLGDEPLTDRQYADLAHQVGLLHQSLDTVEVQFPFVDTFDIPFERELVRHIERGKGSQSSLAALLFGASAPAGVWSDMLSYLEKLNSLQAIMSNTTHHRVICHTDLHGGNFMVDEQNRLVILDWENAMIAPPEHDLMFFVGDGRFFSQFWPRYVETSGVSTIDCNRLRFYFYRRALEDITDYIIRINAGDGSLERDRMDAEGIVGYLFDLSYVESTVEQVNSKVGT